MSSLLITVLIAIAIVGFVFYMKFYQNPIYTYYKVRASKALNDIGEYLGIVKKKKPDDME